MESENQPPTLLHPWYGPLGVLDPTRGRRRVDNDHRGTCLPLTGLVGVTEKTEYGLPHTDSERVGRGRLKDETC